MKICGELYTESVSFTEDIRLLPRKSDMTIAHASKNVVVDDFPVLRGLSGQIYSVVFTMDFLHEYGYETVD